MRAMNALRRRKRSPDLNFESLALAAILLGALAVFYLGATMTSEDWQRVITSIAR